jgi:hypothetical protein
VFSFGLKEAFKPKRKICNRGSAVAKPSLIKSRLKYSIGLQGEDAPMKQADEPENEANSSGF